MAITFVQSANNTSTGVTSLNKAFTSNLGSASLVVVGFRFNDVGRTLSVNDNNGGVYLQAGTNFDLTVDGDSGAIFYALNHNSGATTVTCSVSGAAGRITFGIHEYSGIAVTNALDKTDSSAHTNSGTSLATGTITTTIANELIFTMVNALSEGSTNWTASVGYNVRENVAAPAIFMATADKIVSATGNQSNTWSTGGSPVEIASGIVSFADTPINPGRGRNNNKLSLLGVGY